MQIYHAIVHFSDTKLESFLDEFLNQRTFFVFRRNDISDAKPLYEERILCQICPFYSGGCKTDAILPKTEKSVLLPFGHFPLLGVGGGGGWIKIDFSWERPQNTAIPSSYSCYFTHSSHFRHFGYFSFFRFCSCNIGPCCPVVFFLR